MAASASNGRPHAGQQPQHEVADCPYVVASKYGPIEISGDGTVGYQSCDFDILCRTGWAIGAGIPHFQALEKIVAKPFHQHQINIR